MLIQQTEAKKRRGAAVVEMALVSILLFMMLFGIFEYCRLLYVMHVTHNAARDTVRYAVVHTSGGNMAGEPTTISHADLVSMVQSGQIGNNVVGSGMAGMDGSLENCTIEIFTVDPAGLNQNPPVIQPLAGSNWNSAAFNQKIAVRISGDYRPVLPSLLFMNSTVPVQVTVLAASEAN